MINLIPWQGLHRLLLYIYILHLFTPCHLSIIDLMNISPYNVSNTIAIHYNHLLVCRCLYPPNMIYFHPATFFLKLFCLPTAQCCSTSITIISVPDNSNMFCQIDSEWSCTQHHCWRWWSTAVYTISLNCLSLDCYLVLGITPAALYGPGNLG